MNTVLNIRTNKEIRDKAKKIFTSIGISTSAGINMFLHQVVAEKGLPFKPVSDLKQIRKKWDTDVAKAIDLKGYKNSTEALRGL